MAKVIIQYDDPRNMSVELSDESARFVESLAVKLALLDEYFAAEGQC